MAKTEPDGAGAGVGSGAAAVDADAAAQADNILDQLLAFSSDASPSAEWDVHVDAVTSREYFFNPKTGESRWTDPSKAPTDSDWEPLEDKNIGLTYV
mgnify:FL=1